MPALLRGFMYFTLCIVIACGSIDWAVRLLVQRHALNWLPAQSRSSGGQSVRASHAQECVLVLTVFSRWKTLGDRLAHYQNLPEASSILVIANDPGLTPAHLPDPDFFSVPVTYKFMQKNSMNNRLFPWPELVNECIVLLDDDNDANLAHLSRAIRLWRTKHRERLVGFSTCGRNHVHDDESGKYTYCTNGDHAAGFAASMVLPACGMVFHRKFLELYTFATPQLARDIVDETMNGDDILLNFVASNHTGKCPVLLKGSKDGFVSDLSASGLWSRSQHFKDRSAILDRLVPIFGKMPLSYATGFMNLTDVHHGPPPCMTHVPEQYTCKSPGHSFRPQ